MHAPVHAPDAAPNTRAVPHKHPVPAIPAQSEAPMQPQHDGVMSPSTCLPGQQPVTTQVCITRSQADDWYAHTKPRCRAARLTQARTSAFTADPARWPVAALLRFLQGQVWRFVPLPLAVSSLLIGCVGTACLVVLSLSDHSSKPAARWSASSSYLDSAADPQRNLRGGLRLGVTLLVAPSAPRAPASTSLTRPRWLCYVGLVVVIPWKYDR